MAAGRVEHEAVLAHAGAGDPGTVEKAAGSLHIGLALKICGGTKVVEGIAHRSAQLRHGQRGCRAHQGGHRLVQCSGVGQRAGLLRKVADERPLDDADRPGGHGVSEPRESRFAAGASQPSEPGRLGGLHRPGRAEHPVGARQRALDAGAPLVGLDHHGGGHRLGGCDDLSGQRDALAELVLAQRPQPATDDLGGRRERGRHGAQHADDRALAQCIGAA